MTTPEPMTNLDVILGQAMQNDPNAANELSRLFAEEQGTSPSSPLRGPKPIVDPVPWLGETRESWWAPQGGRKQKLMSAADVALEALRMPMAEKQRLADRMQAVGLLDEGAVTQDEFEDAWNTLVGYAVAQHAANPDAMLTPIDMIDLYTENLWGEDAVDEKKIDPPKVSKVIEKKREIATNDEARTLLSSMLTRELGRRATDKEIDDFQAALNEAQRKNPFTTTQYMDSGDGWGREFGAQEQAVAYDEDGNEIETASTLSRGGVDPEQFASRYFDENIRGGLDSEYGAYTAATSYMSALMQALTGGVVSGGNI